MANSNDSFTETTSTGWFSRLGKSISAVLFGIFLALVSVPLLWWNEGRSVTTAKGLAEGAKVTVEASADQVDAKNDGKLIHMTAKVEAKDTVQDAEFGVSAPGFIKLKRDLETYQWVEKESSKTKTKVGGGEETVKEYTYTKQWDDKAHNSDEFRNKIGHTNQPSTLTSATFVTGQATFSAYRLSDVLLSQWNDYVPHPLPAIDALPEALRAKATLQGEWLVLSATPDAPQLGDHRVRYQSIPAGEASILARQIKDTFEAYTTSFGTSIARITTGLASTESMFAAAVSENNIMTWILRVVGFFAMFLGLVMILAPLKVLADVIPFVGSIVGAGTGFVAFLIAVIGSCITIAFAWLYYRPLLGIGLLAVAGFGLYLLKGGLQKKAA